MTPVKKKAKKAVAKKIKTPAKKVAKKAVKQSKALPKKKVVKKATAKKVIKRSPVKAKKVVAKRVPVKKDVPAKKNVPSKKIAKKIVKKAEPQKAKSPAKKIVLKKRETKRPRRGSEKIPAFSSTTEIKPHGEDLHFIPQHDNIQPPITTMEVHAAENMLHHKDDVAFRQENKKVQQTIMAAKNIKMVQRKSGRGRMK